jgi:small conductance mechanosensitive channel
MNLILLAQAAGESAADAARVALRNGALEKIRQLRFTDLSGQEWIYVGEYYGLRAMFVIVLMILAWTVSAWASALVQTALTRVKFDETLTKFFARLVRWLLLLLVALSCISYFGVDTTSFAAVIGAAGLAIGLAFQGTLSNFAAGGMLLIFRPYKVGDTINAAGVLGVVNEIALFTTEVDTFDGRRIIVPNGAIYGAVIENVTYHRRRRIDVAVGAAYEADIDTTRKVLDLALRSVPQIAADPKPAAVLIGLGASSVDWSVRGWVFQKDFADAKEALIRAVKVELDRAGIAIAFPQLDVHVSNSSPERAA